MFKTSISFKKKVHVFNEDNSKYTEQKIMGYQLLTRHISELAILRYITLEFCLRL